MEDLEINRGTIGHSIRGLTSDNRDVVFRGVLAWEIWGAYDGSKGPFIVTEIR